MRSSTYPPIAAAPAAPAAPGPEAAAAPAYSALAPEEIARILALSTRKRRVELGFTRQQLADKSAVPHSTIKLFEATGNISLKSFVALVAALDHLSDLGKIFAPPRGPTPPNVILRRQRKRQRGGPTRRGRAGTAATPPPR